MIDIDFFKKVNDTYGHDKGDLVLKKITNILKQELRSTDVLCRYGGEEFMIMMPEIRMEQAMYTAERLRKKVMDTDIELNSDKKINLTISLGVAESQIADSFDSIIKRVDEALYKAKDSGRNCVKN
jgi:diguanylate cyclase (GGDEF)-like protein